MRLMISCADPSSFLYAKNLINTLKDAEVFGFAKKTLENAQVQIIEDLSKFSVIGLNRIFSNAVQLFSVLVKAKKLIKERRPHALLVFDFPEFNIHLARIAKKEKVKVVYLFPPAVWAWREGRAKDISHICDLIICGLPFEPDIYKKYGARAFFFGHPLSQLIKKKEERNGRNLALFPGSRKDEVHHLLPIMWKAASFLKNHSLVSVKIATLEDTRGIIKKMLVGEEFECASSYELMEWLDFAFVCSGTATLELALASAPMIIMYKLDLISWMVAKRFVKTPFVGLPNILLKEYIFPELLQNISIKELIHLARKIMDDERQRNRMKEASVRIRQMLYGEDIYEKMSESIISLIKNG